MKENMDTDGRQVITQKPEITENNRPRVAHQQFIASTYSGPLPPAEAFEHYERVCPGAADRIIAMAEQQASHRQELEKRREATISRNSQIGIVSALLLAIFILVGGVICVILGHDWAGGVIVSLDLGSLCAVFVYGTNMRDKEQ